MKKPEEERVIRPEYAFGRGVRGKYAGRVREEDITYPDDNPGREDLPRIVAGVIEDAYAALNQIASAMTDLQPRLAQWAAWDLMADAALKRFAEQGYPEAQIESILTVEQLSHLMEKAISQPDANVDVLTLNRLMFQFTCQPFFAAEIRHGMQGLDFLAPRVRHFDAMWSAHSTEQFLLAIPAAIILIEGTVGEFNTHWRGRSHRMGKLKQKIEDSRLKDHEHFEQAAKKLVNEIVPQRNAILHGNAIDYDSEELSTKLLICFHGLIDTMNLVSKN